MHKWLAIVFLCNSRQKKEKHSGEGETYRSEINMTTRYVTSCLLALCIYLNVVDGLQPSRLAQVNNKGRDTA